jgi:O-antigen/teichoic acid export membrane protein
MPRIHLHLRSAGRHGGDRLVVGNRQGSLLSTWMARGRVAKKQALSAALNRQSRWLLLIFDQALYSITSFLPIMIVAKLDGAEAVGAFAVCAGINAVALGITQGIATDAGFVLKRGSPTADGVIASVVAAPFACASAVVAALLTPGYGWLAIGILLAQPLKASQFAMRNSALLARNTRAALASDAVAVVVLVVYGAVCWLSGSFDWRVTYIVWCVAAGLGILPVAGGLQAVRGFRLAAEWRARWVVGRAFAGETVITQGASQMIIWVTAALTSISVAGSLRIAQQAMFPMVIGIAAARSVALPYLDRHRASVAKSVAKIAGPLAITTVLVGIAVYALPLWVGTLLFGQPWAAARDAVPWTGLQMSAAAIALPISLALRIARDHRASLLAKTGSAALQVMSVVLACVLFSDPGRIAATIGVVMLLSVIPWLVALGHASRLSKKPVQRKESTRPAMVISGND